MSQLLLRRAFQALFVLFSSTLVVFFMLRLSGDPAQLMLGMSATAQDVAEFRRKVGLDQPIAIQYVRFVAGILRGDFGDSIQQGQPALGLVIQRLPATAELAVTSLLLSLGIAIPLGVLAARRRGGLVDRVAVAVSALGQSMPPYWLGLILILVFAVMLRWLPSYGRGGLAHLVLPSITLALFFMGRTTRLMRASMLEVLTQDYLRTARAKGLSEWTVVGRHALRNAMMAVVTIVGMDFSVLMGGAVITETVFSWPGLGRMLIQSIFDRDYPVVQVAVFVIAVIVVVANAIVDILYIYLDPRIRRV